MMQSDQGTILLNNFYCGVKDRLSDGGRGDRHVLLQGQVGLVVVMGQRGNLGGQPLNLPLLGQHLLGLHGVGGPRLLQLSGGLGS